MDFFKYINDNKLILLIISIFGNILLFSGCIYFGYRLYNTNCSVCENNELSIINEVSDKSDTCEYEEPTNNSFYVEVKGAVKKPGVYLVNDENIINDLINLAGGFNKNAYSKNINLSKKLTKELVIYVYTNSEYNKNNKEDTKEIINEVVCECPTYDISECTNNTISEIVSNETSNENIITNNKEQENSVNNTNNDSINSDLININTASKEELMKLTGIGESKAVDIITYRETYGNFKSIEDIKNVSGIGNSIYEKIKDFITV